MGRDRLKHPNGVSNVLSLTALVTSTEICKTNRGAKLIQFNNVTQDMLFPCKYWALREQKCGKYKINLSPGHRWLYPNYFLETLWLGVVDTESGLEWEGRTSNKIAVKVCANSCQGVC